MIGKIKASRDRAKGERSLTLRREKEIELLLAKEKYLVSVSELITCFV